MNQFEVSGIKSQIDLYDILAKSVTMSAIQSIFAEHKFNQTIKSE